MPEEEVKVMPPTVPEEEQEPVIPLEQTIQDIGILGYNDYKQLVYLGKIIDEYEALGHTFKAHTLNMNEEINLSCFLTRFPDTFSYNKAFWVECLAYILDEIDGKSIGGTILKLGEAGDGEYLDNKRKELM